MIEGGEKVPKKKNILIFLWEKRRKRDRKPWNELGSREEKKSRSSPAFDMSSRPVGGK